MMVTELLLLHVTEVCLISQARIVTHMAKRILFVVRIIILRQGCIIAVVVVRHSLTLLNLHVDDISWIVRILDWPVLVTNKIHVGWWNGVTRMILMSSRINHLAPRENSQIAVTVKHGWKSLGMRHIILYRIWSRLVELISGRLHFYLLRSKLETILILVVLHAKSWQRWHLILIWHLIVLHVNYCLN